MKEFVQEVDDIPCKILREMIIYPNTFTNYKFSIK